MIAIMQNKPIRSGLRYRRYEAGLTQTELGELAGVKQGTISGIEAGGAVGRPATLKALADALGCTVADLMPVESDEVPA